MGSAPKWSPSVTPKALEEWACPQRYFLPSPCTIWMRRENSNSWKVLLLQSPRDLGFQVLAIVCAGVNYLV